MCLSGWFYYYRINGIDVFWLWRNNHFFPLNGKMHQALFQGMQHLPATFAPGPRLGPGLDATLEKLQRICDEQQLAAPITVHKETAVID